MNIDSAPYAMVFVLVSSYMGCVQWVVTVMIHKGWPRWVLLTLGRTLLEREWSLMILGSTPFGSRNV